MKKAVSVNQRETHREGKIISMDDDGSVVTCWLEHGGSSKTTNSEKCTVLRPYVYW